MLFDVWKLTLKIDLTNSWNKKWSNFPMRKFLQKLQTSSTVFMVGSVTILSSSANVVENSSHVQLHQCHNWVETRKTRIMYLLIWLSPKLWSFYPPRTSAYSLLFVEIYWCFLQQCGIDWKYQSNLDAWLERNQYK